MPTRATATGTAATGARQKTGLGPDFLRWMPCLVAGPDQRARAVANALLDIPVGERDRLDPGYVGREDEAVSVVRRPARQREGVRCGLPCARSGENGPDRILLRADRAVGCHHICKSADDIRRGAARRLKVDRGRPPLIRSRALAIKRPDSVD